MNKFPLVGLLQKLNNNIKMKVEWEKQMTYLKAVTGENVDANKKILSLVSWFRNEYAARPEKYIGDHWPIKLVRDNVANGLDLDLSILEAYDRLKSHFFVIDKQREYNSDII